MRVSWKGGIATVAAAGMLVVGVDYVSFAATGDSLILGRFNTATKPTTLSNQGAGPALRLKTSANNIPPLAVNSSRKVRKLNADQVDGRDAAQLSTHVLTYTAGHRGENFADGFAVFDVPLKAGVYQASFRAGLTPQTQDPNGAEVICGIADVNTLGPHTKVYVADSTFSAGTGAPSFLSGAETVRITDKNRPVLLCTTQTNSTAPFTLFGPMKASFASVAGRVNRTAQPAQPPTPPRGGIRLVLR